MKIKINIETIPHKDHRYETVGDYWIDDNGVRQIRISEMKDWRKMLLVAVHEMIEQSLCIYYGVSEKDITEFDMEFEKQRESGLHSDDAEPGDDVNSPYRSEHFFATNVERLLAAELGVDWNEYDKEIMSL